MEAATERQLGGIPNTRNLKAILWILLLLAGAEFIVRGPVRFLREPTNWNDLSQSYTASKLWLQGKSPSDPKNFSALWKQQTGSRLELTDIRTHLAPPLGGLVDGANCGPSLESREDDLARRFVERVCGHGMGVGAGWRFSRGSSSRFSLHHSLSRACTIPNGNRQWKREHPRDWAVCRRDLFCAWLPRCRSRSSVRIGVQSKAADRCLSGSLLFDTATLETVRDGGRHHSRVGAGGCFVPVALRSIVATRLSPQRQGICHDKQY